MAWLGSAAQNAWLMLFVPAVDIGIRLELGSKAKNTRLVAFLGQAVEIGIRLDLGSARQRRMLGSCHLDMPLKLTYGCILA